MRSFAPSFIFPFSILLTLALDTTARPWLVIRSPQPTRGLTSTTSEYASPTTLHHHSFKQPVPEPELAPNLNKRSSYEEPPSPSSSLPIPSIITSHPPFAAQATTSVVPLTSAYPAMGTSSVKYKNKVKGKDSGKKKGKKNANLKSQNASQDVVGSLFGRSLVATLRLFAGIQVNNPHPMLP